MGKNKELGQEGERLAAEYLQDEGWKIVERNYRHGHAEIDLIALNNDLLIFVEVKIRTNTAYGMPEDFVTEKQAENILKAAGQFMQEKDWNGNIRFDIISIIKSKRIELSHIKDAFY